MSRYVFILGAGASAHTGAPLMAGFLDRAEDLLRRVDVEIDRAAFKRVFRAISELERAHSKATLDTLNIESVLGAFEMARLFGKVGTLTESETNGLAADMATLIVDTLEQTVIFPNGNGRVTPTRAYEDFAKRIKAIQSTDDSASVAIITFNYDVALEVALASEGIWVNYALNGSERPRHVDVLKLHGSVTWTASADAIVGLDVSDLLARLERVPRTELSGPILTRRALSSVPGAVPPYTPFIVPPTWSKMAHYARIEPVWRRAAHHLAEAEHIYAIGYSLPPSDHFFRLLYGLGTIGPSRLKCFRVIDRDASGDVEKRFRELLGPTALQRYSHIRADFESAIPLIL